MTRVAYPFLHCSEQNIAIETLSIDAMESGIGPGFCGHVLIRILGILLVKRNNGQKKETKLI